MKRVLHVGCGTKTLAKEPLFRGWQETRLDLDPAVKPDIVGSLTDLSAIGAASMDAVFSSHNLEHLYAHDVPVALREFRRVLKDDGFAIVLVPDLEAAAQRIAEGRLHEPMYVSPAGPVTPFDMLYGYSPALKASPLMAHKGGFTQKSLAAALAAVFPVVSCSRDRHFNVRALAFAKPMSREDAQRAVEELAKAAKV
ncbi:MAG TPA: methyltransferase domain-containing protein [Burkholderiales bacterium]|nr:methyltransferase domain-containing protein [Burkholderiales bacterium]